METTELEAWLTLLRAPTSRGNMRRLVEHCGCAATALNASDRLLTDFGLSAEARAWLAEPDTARIKADMDWLDAPDCHFITQASPHWPSLLTEIPDPPLALFIRGNPELLSEPQLAMVGSRNPTPAGRETAIDFASNLASVGLVITSGLALGIDGASHEGALKAGGATIAVCGTGLDRIYPARHRTLAHDITTHGALVSEYPLGAKPRRYHFPERNRLVSGLSLGVLVVEAAQRSGSLISARLASEQGREVFAIPGSIHNPMARGCHRLIRSGAKLVETSADVLEELAPLLNLALTNEVAAKPADNPVEVEHMQVLKYIDFAPTSVDCVVERSGLTPAAVSAMLLTLELQGSIATAPGGGYMRTSK